jgi:alginate export protein
VKNPLNNFAFLLIALAVAAQAESASANDDKLDLQFRYRYELVDQAGIDKEAHASTLRTRLAYRSRYFSDFAFQIEFDDIRVVGNELYNSTRNGIGDRPVVADPAGTDLNQALILYRGIDSTLIRAGRQRIKLDNDRFIGDVGWRQNDQTYDGLSLTNTSLPKTTIDYAFIDNVNRIFGPDSGSPPAEFSSNSHILNAKYALAKNWTVTAYGYFLDLEDAPSSSNRTVGARVTGSVEFSEDISSSYTVEYARQQDYGDNPNDYSTDYFLLEGALVTAGITGKLGYEVLGADSVQAFQTPLATLHAFQGWADKFLSTPIGGIEDLYALLGAKILGANFSLIYHRFNPEAVGPSYGSEWDLVIRKPIDKRYSVVLKYANYDARSYASDTEKLWVMLSANFGK